MSRRPATPAPQTLTEISNPFSHNQTICELVGKIMESQHSVGFFDLKPNTNNPQVISRIDPAHFLKKILSLYVQTASRDEKERVISLLRDTVSFEVLYDFILSNVISPSVSLEYHQDKTSNTEPLKHLDDNVISSILSLQKQPKPAVSNCATYQPPGRRNHSVPPSDPVVTSQNEAAERTQHMATTTPPKATTSLSSTSSKQTESRESIAEEVQNKPSSWGKLFASQKTTTIKFRPDLDRTQQEAQVRTYNRARLSAFVESENKKVAEGKNLISQPKPSIVDQL